MTPSRSRPVATLLPLVSLCTSAGVACDRLPSGWLPSHEAPVPAQQPTPPNLLEDEPGPAVVGSTDRVYTVGELGHARSYTLSVEQLQECKPQPPFQPKRGYYRLGIEVVIEGTGTAEVPVNPFYGTVEDHAKDEHHSTLADCESGLRPVRVTKGQSARGWITFDLPRSSRELRFVYSPMIIGVGRDRVRFDLGR